MPPHQPGDAVASRCKRCGDITGHTVVALVGDKIVKVACRACGSTHRYLPPQDAKPARKETARRVGQGVSRADAIRKAFVTEASSFAAAVSPSAGRVTGARAAKAAQTLEDEWRRAIAPAPGSSARPYAMQERFAVGEVIEHPVFGSGLVRETLPPDKMRVLFRDGLRLLRCVC
ncbi:MAG: hypothetical protein LBC10_03555 [Deltaproteobacteria bacterium]|jgi:hypothetical protein|nr:hypothetical protein [Deltaproteobacteria bacterium]